MSGFVKADAGKLRFDLVDHRFERELAEVLTHGAKKYADNNWKLANPAEAKARYRAALRRHYDLWMDGQEFDADSGCPHLACMTACLMFLRWFERENRVPLPITYDNNPCPTHPHTHSWNVPLSERKVWAEGQAAVNHRLGDDAVEASK